MPFKPFSTWGEAAGKQEAIEEPEGFFNAEDNAVDVEPEVEEPTVPEAEVVSVDASAEVEPVKEESEEETESVAEEPEPEEVSEETTVDTAQDTEEVPVVSDAVNHPKHYTCSKPEFETIEVIDAYGMDFSLGNAYKYIIRAKSKGYLIQDLKKAAWYLQRVITRNKVFSAEVTTNASLCNLQVPTVEDIAEEFNLDYQQSKAVDNIFEYAMTGNISAIAIANNAILKDIDRLSAE